MFQVRSLMCRNTFCRRGLRHGSASQLEATLLERSAASRRTVTVTVNDLEMSLVRPSPQLSPGPNTRG